MKKMTVKLTSVVFVVTIGMSMSALGQGLDDCQAQAGQARYELETKCYHSYGPKSGKWSVQDTSTLDVCLENAGTSFSSDMLQCPTYMAAGSGRPPYENRESAVAAAIGLTIGIFLLLAI